MIREHFHLDWFARGRKHRFHASKAKVRYMNELMQEELTSVAPIYPASNNGLQYTNTVDMSKYNRIMFHVVTGTVNGGGNVVFQLQQTNNSNGQSNTNVAQTNSGTGTKVTITGSSQEAMVEARADQIAPYRYVQGSMQVNNNVSICGAFGWTSEARQHPAGTSVNNADASLQTTSGVLNQFYA